MRPDDEKPSCAYCIPSVQMSVGGEKVVQHECDFDFVDGVQWSSLGYVGDVRLTAIRSYYRDRGAINLSREIVIPEIRRPTLSDARGETLWALPTGGDDWERVARECLDYISENRRYRLWADRPGEAQS